MTSSRIVIETSTAQKEALDDSLQKRGVTLTDWFNSKVSEIAPVYHEHSSSEIEIQSLSEIADPKSVLSRISQVDWAFTESITTYLSHDLHPYPAKFIPQIPNTLIKLLSLRGEKVWDPFGGSGTTSLEALLLGRQTISSDVHPIASLIGQAKTTTLTSEDEDELIDFVNKLRILGQSNKNIDSLFDNYSNDVQQYIPDIPNLEKWFHPYSIFELGYLRWKISQLKNETSRLLAKAILSKIIVKVSFQDGETRYVSKPRDVEKGATFIMFRHELNSAINQAKKISQLLQFRTAEFATSDLRYSKVVQPDSIDLIITSPPYPNATDYHLYHRFRLFWLGYDPRDVGKKEIGSHLRHQKENTGIENYLSEMELCLKHMFEGLRSGRYAVLVLGDAKFKGKIFNTAELVGQCANDVGFNVVGIVSREVHSTKRSFVSAARRLREESLLILQKPSRQSSFHLLAPPYKLWAYEEQLRKLETENLLNMKLPNSAAEILPVKMTPLDADKLKRLTFTHGFWSEIYHRESTWQAILENGDAFKNQNGRKDPKYSTHGLHPYKGKFYPQLAKSLLNIAKLEPGKRVLDPFSGSGTVLLECYLNGLNAIGFDLNPLAIKITRAKTAILQLSPEFVDKMILQFVNKLEQITSDEINLEYLNQDVFEELESWFPLPVLSKLGWIIRELEQIPDPVVRNFFEVCLSSIVRDISQQDPKDLRIRRRKNQIEDAPVKILFTKKLLEQRWRLREFAKRTNKAPQEFGQVSCFQADSRDITAFDKTGVALNTIDAVVTSPPYATALPYIDTDRLSILLLFSKKSKERSQIEESLIGSREIKKSNRRDFDLQIEDNDFDLIISPTARKLISEIYELNRDADVGFRRKNKAALLYRYYYDMAEVFTNLDKVVRKNGDLFFVIGDNKTVAGDQEKIISSSKILQETGDYLGWKIQDVIPISVTQENRRHNKNSITENDIIWFRKT